MRLGKNFIPLFPGKFIMFHKLTGLSPVICMRNFPGLTLWMHNQFFQWGVSAGTIGKASLGKEMQNSFHRLINVNRSWGWIWDYQLKTEPGVNLHGLYAKELLKY